MPPTTFTARLEEKTVHNDRFIQLAFELVEPHRFPFFAGQYVSIQVSEQGERRAYSICSSPGIDHGFELLIDTRPAGLGSTYLASLQFGDEIKGIGPIGQFTIAESNSIPESQIVLIATGSGIAPFRSMILDLLQEKKDQRPLSLYWGMRYAHEFFWLQDFEILVDAFQNFNFYPILSQPSPEWTLSTGHVTDLPTAHNFPPQTGFYLCGSQQMVKDNIAVLFAKGVDSQFIHHEKFY